MLRTGSLVAWFNRPKAIAWALACDARPCLLPFVKEIGDYERFDDSAKDPKDAPEITGGETEDHKKNGGDAARAKVSVGQGGPLLGNRFQPWCLQPSRGGTRTCWPATVTP